MTLYLQTWENIFELIYQRINNKVQIFLVVQEAESRVAYLKLCFWWNKIVKFALIEFCK